MYLFRLNYLEVSAHPILGNIQMEFCPEDSSAKNGNELFSSIVIGQNGTGKSTVLKVISEIFREFDLRKKNSKYPLKFNYHFRLRYTINNILYEIASNRLISYNQGKPVHGYSFFRDNPLRIEDNSSIIDKILPFDKFKIPEDELELPKKVLASSLMLTDKFNSRPSVIYKYLGVRNEQSPNSSGTRTYVRKTVNNIVDGIQRKNFRDELRQLFNFVELDASLMLSYVPRYKKVFYNGNITSSDLSDIFENKWQEIFPRRKSPLWGANNFRNMKSNPGLIEHIADFLNEIHQRVFINGNKRSIEYDVINDDRLPLEYDMIDTLRQLDILSYPTLYISRNDKLYEFSTGSSGEAHMLSEFIGILSQIKENSIVLIDEPEISLHPNWQILYMDYIKKIFHRYPSSHFVIATHSHFLLSNIKPETSNVIALDKEDAIITPRSIDYGTFGWSPENILYNVFKVPTARNYYFEMDVQKLLSLISSNSKNREQMLGLVEKLNDYILSEDDPLRTIINKAQNYVENEI